MDIKALDVWSSREPAGMISFALLPPSSALVPFAARAGGVARSCPRSAVQPTASAAKGMDDEAAAVWKAAMETAAKVQQDKSGESVSAVAGGAKAVAQAEAKAASSGEAAAASQSEPLKEAAKSLASNLFGGGIVAEGPAQPPATTKAHAQSPPPKDGGEQPPSPPRDRYGRDLDLMARTAGAGAGASQPGVGGRPAIDTERRMRSPGLRCAVWS